MNQPVLTVSVIVPTRDRISFLSDCLTALANQTHPPHEVLVVSACSDTSGVNDLVSDFSRKHPCISIKLLYSRPGTATQRNLGAKTASGDILLFVDDDVILAPNFLAGIVGPYLQDDGSHIGGVQGVIVEHPRQRGRIRGILGWLFAVFFLQSRTSNCQKVLISGKYIGFPPRAGSPQAMGLLNEYSDAVQWMSGGCMSVLRSVVTRHKLFFDETFETLGNFAHMEDGDYSYRIFLNGYRLVRTGTAVCFHSSAPGSRRNIDAHYAIKVFNHFIFWRKNIGLTLLSVIAHLWSQIGLIIEALVKSIGLCSGLPLVGVVNGWVAIARRRLRA